MWVNRCKVLRTVSGSVQGLDIIFLSILTYCLFQPRASWYIISIPLLPAPQHLESPVLLFSHHCKAYPLIWANHVNNVFMHLGSLSVDGSWALIRNLSMCLWVHFPSPPESRHSESSPYFLILYSTNFLADHLEFLNCNIIEVDWADWPVWHTFWCIESRKIKITFETRILGMIWVMPIRGTHESGEK